MSDAPKWSVFLERGATQARQSYVCTVCSEMIQQNEWHVPYHGHFCLPCWQIYVARSFEAVSRLDVMRMIKDLEKLLKIREPRPPKLYRRDRYDFTPSSRVRI